MIEAMAVVRLFFERSFVADELGDLEPEDLFAEELAAAERRLQASDSLGGASASSASLGGEDEEEDEDSVSSMRQAKVH